MDTSSPWKAKVHSILQACQEEFKRTTQIGKKMLSASKVNTCLRESYEELGKYTAECLEKNELQWDNGRAQELLQTIQECRKTLEEIEGEVNQIKFSKD
jgi:hypothetical protein